MYRSVLGIYFFVFGSPISLPVCTVQCKHFKKENTNEKKNHPVLKNILYSQDLEVVVSHISQSKCVFDKLKEKKI